jgi:hypothetical protein
VAVACGKEDEYFAQAISQIRKWRKNVAKDSSDDDSVTSCLTMGPMDKLRLELDEIWPGGCMLMKDKGRPYMGGIPRIMRPAKHFDPLRWSRGFIHVDALEVMTNERGVYSANVYLQNAPSGGEVLLWPISFHSRWQFFRNAYTLSMCLSQDPDSQAYLRDRLPPPVSVMVKEGDLLLLCTQRPHAVKGPIVGGTRVSMQVFMQYEKDKPFLLEA